jgi:acyl-CoA dehydrogenase
MAWDFSTDEEYAEKIRWAEGFVRSEIEPLDVLHPDEEYVPPTGELKDRVRALQAEVRRRGLWATHLGPDLGGDGYGQVALALLNEVLGRSAWAPIIFGTQAPDTGNAEILAKYGTDEQKRRYLRPLIDGEIFSCYSMTEPQGGSDPGVFRTSARQLEDGWELDGWKFFSSCATHATFFVTMAVTDPGADLRRRFSMFLIPSDAPGLKVMRELGLGGDALGHGNHGLVQYDRVRLPADAMLGAPGAGFEVAQARLGGGRIHHAMRTVGLCNRIFEMMQERAVSRRTKGSLLAEKGTIQSSIADSWLQIQQFRLLVLHAAWTIDNKSLEQSRQEIAAVKIAAPTVLHDVASRAIQMHGALGLSNELPLWRWLLHSFHVGIADGPVEVHKISLARQLLKGAVPAPGVWPSEHVPTRLGLIAPDVQQALERHVSGAAAEEIAV